MGTTQQKIDANTLCEITSIVTKNDDSWYREQRLCREFNFLARQRTTSVEFTLWNKVSKVQSTGAALTVENFRDIEGQEEIARAHAALVKLGGNPPALEEVLASAVKPGLKPFAGARHGG
jgi:hypothetical protein